MPPETITDLTAAEAIISSCVSRVLRLTLLAADIVEAILHGRQPEGMTLLALMEPFPAPWRDQPGGSYRFAAIRREIHPSSLQQLLSFLSKAMRCGNH